MSSWKKCTCFIFKRWCGCSQSFRNYGKNESPQSRRPMSGRVLLVRTSIVPWGVSFFFRLVANIEGNRLQILENFSTHAANCNFRTVLFKSPVTSCQTLFENLLQAILQTFLKQQEQTTCTEHLRSPIFSSGDPAREKADTLTINVRFTKLTKFFTESSLQILEIVWAAMSWAMCDVSIVWNWTVLDLECEEFFMIRIQATEIRNLLYDGECSVQSRHNNISIRKNAGPGYFVVVNGEYEGELKVCKVFHPLDFYPRYALVDFLLFRFETRCSPFTKCVCGSRLSGTCRCLVFRTLRLALPFIHVLGELTLSRFYFVSVSMEPQNCHQSHSREQSCTRRSCTTFRNSTRRPAALHNIFRVASYFQSFLKDKSRIVVD